MIIAGTGHRPSKLGGYGRDIAQRMVRLAGEYIEEMKPDVVISGMALGWDWAVAIAADKQGIEWWAYIPFVGQDATWPMTSRKTYQDLLARAHSVRVVSPGGYAVHKMQVRNEAMVDACDKVLALWDGSRGGTGNCVRYAVQREKPIVNAWEKWRLQ